MKTPSRLDPLAAFPDEGVQPDDAALKRALGRAFAPVEQILAGVRSFWREASSEWKFSKQAGWYRVCLLKKRRLFYLVPKRDGFRLSLILGAKAIAALRAGPHAAAINQLLKTAQRYPEGTAFTFDADNCPPALVAALLAAKLAH